MGYTSLAMPVVELTIQSNELASTSPSSAGIHNCGPNCPQHLFSVTRNQKSSGVDILA
jgi:hypothetical protein